MPIFDIHSHILPFVDDGSDSLDNSLLLLNEAIKNGITDIVATPHYYPSRGYNCSADEIYKSFDLLNNEIKSKGLPVNIYLGMEIYVSDFDNIIQRLENRELLTLNGSDFVLLEYSVSKQPQNILEDLYNLNIHGYKPIIAHIERYKWMELNLAYNIKNENCFLQVNASSFKKFKTKHFCNTLLKNNMIDVIASDAHSSRKNNYQNLGIINEEIII